MWALRPTISSYKIELLVTTEVSTFKNMEIDYRIHTSLSRPTQQLLIDLYSLDKRELGHPWNKNHWINLFCGPREYILIICTNKKKFVGFLLIDLSSRPCAHLLKIVIGKEWQRKGLGRALFYQAQLILTNLNITAFILEVRENNKKAIFFYESLGFCKSHKIKNFYKDGKGALVYSMVF